MPVTLTEAHDLIAAAHAEARSLDLQVAVAVVDEGGLLQALGRMDGAFPLSSQLAESKAIGASLWHRDGAALASLQGERPAFFAQADRLVRLPIIPARGSVLLRREGAVIGAIGVSGASSEADETCALAAVAAVLGG